MILEGLEAALTSLKVDEDGDWWRRLPLDDLTASQRHRLLQDVHLRLLLLGGIRARIGFTGMQDRSTAATELAAARHWVAKANSFQVTVAGAGMNYLMDAAHGQFGDIQALAQLRPTLAVDFYLLGLAHSFFDQMPKDPTFTVLFTLMRRIPYLDVNQPARQAEEYFRLATTYAPDHYWSHFWLARLLEHEKQFANADLAFASCCSLRPDLLDAYCDRADNLLSAARAATPAGRPALLTRARVHVERAIDGDPHSYLGYHALARIEEERKRPVEAEAA